ncbi:MAG: nitroreductase/quinone reductase family protein [Dermatophilus congolensis]|nr:nitroreductase/quinone reductase family protein [Dermatophilus congolensis]
MPNVNGMILALLNSPLGRLGGGTTVILRYTGPKSGKHVELPVWAARDGDRWLVAVGWAEKKRWYKAFRNPTPATITWKGIEHDVIGHLASEAEQPEAMRAYLSRIRAARRSMKGTEPIVVFT